MLFRSKFHLDVSFESGRETLALLGASGSGKSIALKCIAGIETPDAGRIVLDGRVLFDSENKINLSPQERRVGYLFQHYALFPNMTVAENIAAGVRIKDKTQRQAAVVAKISAMHLDGLGNKRPGQLSCGQQQRVALARILASEPDLLLLDEPFSALDDYLRWQLELELADTLSRFGRTAVFVSHNRDEVYRLCDSVCVMNQGRSEPRHPVKDLFAAPATLAACLLTGCKNFSRIRRLDGNSIDAIDWGGTFKTAAAAQDQQDWLGVRAHYIKSAAGPGENNLLCKVDRVIDSVFSTIVILQAPGTGSDFSRIRMELGKDEWAALDRKSVV